MKRVSISSTNTILVNKRVVQTFQYMLKDGIADIFRGIWRFLFPAIKTIAPHAMRAGANFVEDISSGSNWKGSAMKHGATVAEQIPDAIRAGVAARNSQSGSGYRRRRKSRKRQRRDIFS